VARRWVRSSSSSRRLGAANRSRGKARCSPIEFAIDNGLKLVDFMGAGKPDQKYGVRDFKLQFGGDLVEHGRFKQINNKFLYNLGIFGLKILSKFK